MFLGNTSWRSKVIAPWLIDAARGVKSARVNAGEVTRNVLEAALWHKARETCSQEGKGLVYPGWAASAGSLCGTTRKMWQELRQRDSKPGVVS